MICSADEFVKLRISEEQAEYSRAIHEDATLEIWLEVIERFPDMREWVVRNKTVPLEILRVLASDPDRRTRWAVAGKRKLDRQLFDALSRDPDEGVRNRIACNRKVPREILERLAMDVDPMVRSTANNRLASTE
jgi:hypothetical protein